MRVRLVAAVAAVTCSGCRCPRGPRPGPTGLGAPAGPAAFAAGPHGTLTGTSTGAPVGAATVRAGDSATTSDARGRYTIAVPAGTYEPTADAYGYAGGRAPAVTVADGATATRDITLDPLPRATISGTVTDGSGHGWPLPATITVYDVPGRCPPARTPAATTPPCRGDGRTRRG